MSTISSLLLLFLVCLSMHACHGRHLSSGHHKVSNRQVHLSAKDVEKAIIERTSVPTNGKPSLSKERGQVSSANMESVIDKSLGGESTQKPKDSDTLLNEIKEVKKVIPGVVRMESLVSVPLRVPHKKKGREIIMYSDVGLLQTTKIEGSAGRARSLIGSGSHVTNERIDSKENGVFDNVVVMDYEQPHKKPPIHN